MRALSCSQASQPCFAACPQFTPTPTGARSPTHLPAHTHTHTQLRPPPVDVQGLGVAAVQGGAQEEVKLSSWTIVTVLGKFIYLFAASLALGLMFGLFTSWLMKLFKSNSTPQVLPAVRMVRSAAGLLSSLASSLCPCSSSTPQPEV